MLYQSSYLDKGPAKFRHGVPEEKDYERVLGKSNRPANQQLNTTGLDFSKMYEDLPC
jgi:hypothetical protein